MGSHVNLSTHLLTPPTQTNKVKVHYDSKYSTNIAPCPTMGIESANNNMFANSLQLKATNTWGFV